METRKNFIATPKLFIQPWPAVIKTRWKYRVGKKIIVLARTQIWLVRKKVTGSNAKWFFPLMSIQKMTPDTFTVRIDCWIDLFATILCQPTTVQHSLLWNCIKSIFCMISMNITRIFMSWWNSSLCVFTLIYNLKNGRYSFTGYLFSLIFRNDIPLNDQIE